MWTSLQRNFKSDIDYWGEVLTTQPRQRCYNVLWYFNSNITVLKINHDIVYESSHMYLVWKALCNNYIKSVMLFCYTKSLEASTKHTMLYTAWAAWLAVASFTKEVNPWLAKRPLVFYGRLANRGLTSLVKEATGHHSFIAVLDISWAWRLVTAVNLVTVQSIYITGVFFFKTLTDIHPIAHPNGWVTRCLFRGLMFLHLLLVFIMYY